MSAKGDKKGESQHSNLLKLLMAEVDELELVDLDRPEEGDPGELLQEGFAISKLFAIIEFALRHAKDEESLLDGIDMMDRPEALKAINGTFLFEVSSPSLPASSPAPKSISFLVDMRKTGQISKLVPSDGSPSAAKAGRKPDVTIRVADKDMVDLAMGKAMPQAMFLKGRLKVKGNLMLGLKMNNILQKEIAKLSKL